MYVYILKCSDGSFYTGVTNNLELRFRQHQEGINISCYEEFQTPGLAIEMEKKIKGWSRAKKMALISGNFLFFLV